MKHSYEITPWQIDQVGGWRLRLLQGCEEMCCGLLPIDQEQVTSQNGTD